MKISQGQDFILKLKDLKNFQGQGKVTSPISEGQHQCQLRQLPLRAKICIAITETKLYLFNKTQETICDGVGV